MKQDTLSKLAKYHNTTDPLHTRSFFLILHTHCVRKHPIKNGNGNINTTIIIMLV